MILLPVTGNDGRIANVRTESVGGIARCLAIGTRISMRSANAIYRKGLVLKIMWLALAVRSIDPHQVKRTIRVAYFELSFPRNCSSG